MKDLRRAVFAAPQGCGASIYRIWLPVPKAGARVMASLRRNGSAIQRGTTAVASISTRAAFSTSRTTWTSAMAG